MKLLAALKRLLRSDSADPQGVLEAQKLTEQQTTIRASQYGRQPFANIPPTPEVLDPGRERDWR